MPKGVEAEEAGLSEAEAAAQAERAESIGLNHPSYDEQVLTWAMIRDALEGEEAMKRADSGKEYIIVPDAMQAQHSYDRPAWQYRADSSEAFAYVERARYPEVVLRALDIASGKATSRDPQVSGPDALMDVLDDIWADGSDFNTGVLNVLREALSTRAGGLFVNLDEDGQPRICLYPAESVVNWNRRKNKTSLVVLKDSEPSSNPFSHEEIDARMVLGVENGEYYMERWLYDGDDDDWTLQGERVEPTARQNALVDIPYIPLGGWHMHVPPFMPLARTALTYFRASAEYAHIMWWAATPQPFITFGETGNFFGIDEYSASAVQSEGGADSQNIDLRWGSSTPILLRDGQISFAAAPTGALSAHEMRLKSLREEMSGLGARAFQNRAGGQQTAETERMQQAGEGAVVWLVLREVANAITQAVKIAAEWRGIAGYEDFEFEFNKDISFEPFDLGPVAGLVQLSLDGYIRRADVRRFLRKIDVVEPGLSDEELDKQILDEQQQFGAGNQEGGDVNLPPDDDLPLDEDEIDDSGDEDDLDEAA